MLEEFKVYATKLSNNSLENNFILSSNSQGTQIHSLTDFFSPKNLFLKSEGC